MIDPKKDKELDALLDSALARYSAMTPRPGLETRILARVQEAAASEKPAWRDRRWLLAAAGVAVAAMVLFASLSSFHEGTFHHEQTAEKSRPRTNGTAAPVTTAHVEPRRVAPERRFRRTSPPESLRVSEARKPVFPAPEPLSEQERLLLRYLQDTPREEIIAQSHPDSETALTQDNLRNEDLSNMR